MRRGGLCLFTPRKEKAITVPSCRFSHLWFRIITATAFKVAHTLRQFRPIEAVAARLKEVRPQRGNRLKLRGQKYGGVTRQYFSFCASKAKPAAHSVSGGLDQREESGSGSGMNRIETDQESHIVATARGGVPGDRQTESARRRDAFSLIKVTLLAHY